MKVTFEYAGQLMCLFCCTLVLYVLVPEGDDADTSQTEDPEKLSGIYGSYFCLILRNLIDHELL